MGDTKEIEAIKNNGQRLKAVIWRNIAKILVAFFALCGAGLGFYAKKTSVSEDTHQSAVDYIDNQMKSELMPWVKDELNKLLLEQMKEINRLEVQIAELRAIVKQRAHRARPRATQPALVGGSSVSDKSPKPKPDIMEKFAKRKIEVPPISFKQQSEIIEE